MMSLPRCQQRALDAMAAGLQATEPRLAAMFAMFARLATDEAAPGREQLPPTRWYVVVLGRLRALLRVPRRRSRSGRAPRRRARRTLIFGQVAIAAVICAVLLGLTSHAGPGCGRGQPAHVASRFTGRATVPQVSCALSARGIGH
jgi:hypothetical protein